MEEDIKTLSDYEEDYKTLGDYLGIAWRRKFHILIPFILILAVTLLTVFLLPSVYKSTGTILIESQQIPEELIQSTVTSFADERIQIITQRIMTSEQLFGIIRKFDIYADDINSRPRSEILEEMRERVSINQVSADLRSRGRGASAVIAFTISFEHHSPETAQRVANELVTLFLDENIRSRNARAEETSEFLRKESERLGDEIALMEQQIASFKEQNSDSLPETLRLKLERVSTLKTALLTSSGDINSLNERKKLLMIDLATLKREQGVTPYGGNLPEEWKLRKRELAELQNRYISVSARYGADHPDVKAIERQIDAFQSEYGNIVNPEELQQQKKKIEQSLQELTQKYSSDHPDVKKMQRRLDGVVSMIADLEKQVEEPVNTRNAAETNPLILQAVAKIESVDNSIARITEARKDLEEQIKVLEAQINRIPQVERGLDALERDYENIKAKYHEIKSKLLQAELSRSLEQEQKGERFTLLEPPLLPDKPVKPNRPKLFMLGLILSVVGGLGIAGLAETFDGGIRGTRALAAVTRMTPLVTIPYLSTASDTARRKRRNRIILVILVLLGIALVCAVHFFYKPLDLLWFIVLRKLNLT